MAWKIEFDPAAEKEFSKLGRDVQKLIGQFIEKLTEVADPRSRGKALKGNKSGLWRYRIDKYRIICKIEEKRLVIFVIRIAKRDKVYD